MENTFETLEMAQQYANDQAKTLSASIGKTVHTLVFPVDGKEYAIGFLKEPMRAIKMEAIDRMTTGGSTKAGEFLFNACLMKPDSDPIFQSQDARYDDIILGAILSAAKVVTVKIDQSKKNS